MKRSDFGVCFSTATDSVKQSSDAIIVDNAVASFARGVVTVRQSAKRLRQSLKVDEIQGVLETAGMFEVTRRFGFGGKIWTTTVLVNVAMAVLSYLG